MIMTRRPQVRCALEKVYDLREDSRFVFYKECMVYSIGFCVAIYVILFFLKKPLKLNNLISYVGMMIIGL